MAGNRKAERGKGQGERMPAKSGPTLAKPARMGHPKVSGIKGAPPPAARLASHDGSQSDMVCSRRLSPFLLLEGFSRSLTRPLQVRVATFYESRHSHRSRKKPI